MKILNEKLNEFSLSDFYASVYLRASGFDLIGIDKSDSRRFSFVFIDRKDRTKLINDYFSGRATVEPRQFAAAIKDLKSLMFNNALQP